MKTKTLKAKGGIQIRQEKIKHLIVVEYDNKRKYKEEYTLGARISMRIVSILFPGFFKIIIK